ncbi:DUF1330 domain-containing protein [Hydrogenophaga sp. NH-16]|uniref:DUF1330 domain-containing protein n=1 Tax=Hydrogenophaga sp. NH-16 TaxID=2184519 RepID=UPI000FD712BB|nr:DUF1330 domain-containing protein [Hydrogenophaga sp. NH-16]
MKTVNPAREDLSAILAKIPKNVPICMLNLLSFRARALYADHGIDCTGKEAYSLYLAMAVQKVTEVGGALVYSGQAFGSIIGPKDERWDEVLLVRYPSIAAFSAMLRMPDYQAAAVHRTAAVEDARLIATVEN